MVASCGDIFYNSEFVLFDFMIRFSEFATPQKHNKSTGLDTYIRYVIVLSLCNQEWLSRGRYTICFYTFRITAQCWARIRKITQFFNVKIYFIGKIALFNRFSVQGTHSAVV